MDHAVRLTNPTPCGTLDLDCCARAIGSLTPPHAWHFARYHSDNDPFIPLEEAQHVAAMLGSEYFELPKKSHFFSFDSISHMLNELRGKIAVS